MSDYEKFLATKFAQGVNSGIDPDNIGDYLYPYQRTSVEFLLNAGRCAAFLDTGLGKTAIQLEWAKEVSRHGNVLILAPLAVADQTQREGEKFGIESKVCRSQDDVACPISITNYERIHQFDTSKFQSVVLDESSIVKNINSKIKRRIEQAFGHTKYRLACSATPAPNDYLELGQQAEVLGVMRTVDMLSRWFINDSAKTGEWRLKGHARRDFWNWVKSWSVMANKPSDLGDTQTEYILPQLSVHEHVVRSSVEPGSEDLFGGVDVSATGIRKEKKKSFDARIDKVVEIAETDDFVIVWTDTNDESQACTKAIPGAVEVTGSMDLDQKEERLAAFTRGDIRVLVSKASICGFGLNWQHCDTMIFAGTNYSYEKYYQAVRRCWRFGQKREVHAHVVMSENERLIWKVVQDKAEKHRSMVKEVLAA